MMRNSRGPAPLPPPNRHSWFVARLRVASTHCRLADLTFRLLTALSQTRTFSGVPPAKGIWPKTRPVKSV